MDNIITAVFTAGQMQTVAELPLYQWAYGQRLQFEGLDLPEYYQVDFSNFEFCGVSIPQIGGADGVSVPVEVLATGAPVYAFVWLQDETGGKTAYRVTVSVIPRPAPDFGPPSPEEESAVAQAITALNAAGDSAEEAAENAEAWAVGERNGVPVLPGDPTYKNNAKYYAEHGGGGGGGGGDYVTDEELEAELKKSLIYRGQLTAAHDMHDLPLPGMYYIQQSSGVPANFPYANPGNARALVIKSSTPGSHYGETHFIMGATALWVERSLLGDGSSWTPWIKLSDSDTLAESIKSSSISYQGQLTSDDDMHNLPLPGMYYVALSDAPANFPYTGTGEVRVLVNKSSTLDNHAGESHYVMGESGLWIERSINRTGTSWTPWMKLVEQTPLKTDALTLGLHTTPANQGVINAIKRARQMTDIRWTAVSTMQRGLRETGDTYALSHGAAYIGTFAAGREYVGLPYTEQHYIGMDAPLAAFATSIKNDASAASVFTPSEPVASNRACYYGTNCVGLVGYALGIPIISSASYGSIRYMTNKGYLNHAGSRYPLKSLKLCDLLQIEGHVAMITDIITDALGDVTAVEICEATRQGNPVRDVTDGPDGGRCRRVTMQAEDFYTWFEDFVVLRYSNLAKVTYSPSEYSPMVNEAPPLAYWDRPCIPYEGNMHSYSILGTRVVKILIASSFYTHLRVLKDGALFGEYEIGSASNIDVQCANAEAVYTACLVRYADGAEAGRSISCTWAIRPLMTPTQMTVEDGNLTITMSGFAPNRFRPFSVALGTANPLTTAEKARFYKIYGEDLTVTENQDGTVDYTFSVPYDSTKNFAQIRIYSDDFGAGSDTYRIVQ